MAVWIGPFLVPEIWVVLAVSVRAPERSTLPGERRLRSRRRLSNTHTSVVYKGSGTVGAEPGFITDKACGCSDSLCYVSCCMTSIYWPCTSVSKVIILLLWLQYVGTSPSYVFLLLTPMRQGSADIPHLQKGDETLRWSNWPKVTQVVSGRAVNLSPDLLPPHSCYSIQMRLKVH